MKRLLVVLLLGLIAAAPALAASGKTRHVVLIVSDGVRWQEVFTGADPLLLNDPKIGGNETPLPVLKQLYWSDDAKARRKLLFPFLWGTVAEHGQIFGNQNEGSIAQVTNPFWFSYPGYNEMSSGVADPKIDSNQFGKNPNATVFEWLNGLPAYHGKVEIFGTWGTFHDIFNDSRSHLPVRSGSTLVDPADRSPRGRLLRELYETTTPLEDQDPMDSFLHVVLRDHLAKHHPSVLFVGYGDTDTWQHAGVYDAFLHTAHSFDSFVRDLWEQMQSMPEYRGTTTFIITADHGRGSGPVDWKDHGVEQPGSNNVWIAVMGPDTAPLGERKNIERVTQSQIAATIAALLGEDYLKAKPQAAAPLKSVLAGGAAAH